MKKLIFFVLSIVTLLTCSLGLVGCKDSTPLTQSEVATIYKDAAKSIWQMLGKDVPPTLTASGYSLVIPDQMQEETSESYKQGYIHNLSVMTLYVNFIGDLYANENFILTDKVVTFSATATLYGQTKTHTMSMASNIDKQNGKIFSEYVLTDETGSLYMILDIGYDFDQKIATSFRMVYYNVYTQGPDVVRFMNDQKYTADGRCYICTELTEEYSTFLTQYESDFEQRKQNGEFLSHLFSTEYQTLWDLSNELSN